MNKRFLVLLCSLALVSSMACANSGYGPQGGWSGPTVDISTAGEQTILVANQSGQILALDGNRRGQIKWGTLYDEETTSPVYSTLVLGPNNSGLFGTWDGRLIAIDRVNGSEQWSYPLDQGPIIGGVAFSTNTDKKSSWKHRIYAGSSNGTLFALNLSEINQPPTILWEFQTQDKIWGTPLIHEYAQNIDHNILIFGSMDHKVYALNSDTGEELWQFETTGAVAGMPLIIGDTGYAGSFDRHLYAIDLFSGKKKWTFKTDGWLWNQFAVDNLQDADANLYIPSREGTLYALDQEGNLLWQYAADSKVISSPVFTHDNELNLLSMITEEGTLLVFDTTKCPHNGSSCSPIWSYIVGEKVQAPLTVVDGIVYINAMDDSVRGVHLSEAIQLWNRSIAKQD